MDKIQPEISIVIPTYNAESTLENAVSSVIGQSFENWELIIADDASSDGTVRLARELASRDGRIRVVESEVNKGVAEMRNYGVSLSRGQYVAFLDSDDTWHPDKLIIQLGRMRDTDASLCYTSYALVNASGKKARADYIVPDETDYPSMLRENVIGCSTVLISAEVARSHPFSTAAYHEDYVLWLQLLREGHRAVGCKEVLTDWCYHDGSRSYNKLRSLQKRWEVYRKVLKLPLMKSISCTCSYAVAGLRKYNSYD